MASSLATAPAAADGEPFRYRELTRGEIQSELIGRKVEGSYASGGVFTEAFNADLSSLYRDERGEAVGRMSFTGDTFCFAYADDDMSGGCFVVWQRSANCYDFYAALAGTAYTGFLSRALGVGWDARVWRTDAGSTCPNTPVS